MKKFILLAVLLVSVSAADAQVKVEEPEFEGQVMLLTSDSTGVILDREKSIMKSKSNHLGFLPIPGSFLLESNKTVLRFKGSQAKNTVKSGKVRLVIRAEKNTMDPKLVFSIFKFDVKKNNRENLFSKSSMLSGTDMNIDGGTEAINNVHKYGTSSYLIELNLQPGQYGISYSNVPTEAATFGIE